MLKEKTKWFFWLLLGTTLYSGTTAPAALTLGALFGLYFGNPYIRGTLAWNKVLLQVSVVGLGFGLNLPNVWRLGQDSFFYTLISIIFTLVTGVLLGKFFKTPSRTSLLISFGTAICGGSAIAAMAPVIKAENREISAALGTVFTLNAIALLLFPFIGHILNIDQRGFGLWAALAIHDTSSIFGAAASYGNSALAVGITVKLLRVIWIIPVIIGTALVMKSKSEEKPHLPFFLFGFILAVALKTGFPQYTPAWDLLAAFAKQTLIVALFLTGSSLTKEVVRSTGIKAFIQGTVLWLSVSAVSLYLIWGGWIKV